MSESTAGAQPGAHRDGTGRESAGGPPADASPEVLEADLARQRAQLAETVEELHARLDVKTRAQEKVRELKDRATTDSGRPRNEVLGGAAAVLGLVTALIVWRLRRR